MKQLNKKTLMSSDNDREPNFCLACDASDRCDSCDAFDYGNRDCGTCDYGTECSHIG